MAKRRQCRMFTAPESATFAIAGSGATCCGVLREHSGERHRPSAANKRAWKQALRPKLRKLARCEELTQLVAARLSDNWSPEQIAGWLKHMHPGDEDNR